MTSTSPSSLPYPQPAGAADPARTRVRSPFARMGSAAAPPPTVTAKPSAVTDGPAAPPPTGDPLPPGDRRSQNAGQGRPSTAGPRPRGGPGQPPTARPVIPSPTPPAGRAAHLLPMLRQWVATENDRRPDEPLVDFYARRLGSAEALLELVLEHLETGDQ